MTIPSLLDRESEKQLGSFIYNLVVCVVVCGDRIRAIKPLPFYTRLELKRTLIKGKSFTICVNSPTLSTSGIVVFHQTGREWL